MQEGGSIQIKRQFNVNPFSLRTLFSFVQPVFIKIVWFFSKFQSANEMKTWVSNEIEKWKEWFSAMAIPIEFVVHSKRWAISAVEAIAIAHLWHTFRHGYCHQFSPICNPVGRPLQKKWLRVTTVDFEHNPLCSNNRPFVVSEGFWWSNQSTIRCRMYFMLFV